MNLSPLRGAPPLTGKSGGRGKVFRCDVATTFLPHNLPCLTSVLYRIFVKKSIARPLVYTSAALPRGGQGGAQCRPPEQPETEQKRRFPRYAACGKPPFIFDFALRSSGFAAFLLVFVRFRQRKIAPYASIGARLRIFDCLPPQGYAANRFRRRCVKGLMSRSHLMTLSKITYF